MGHLPRRVRSSCRLGSRRGAGCARISSGKRRGSYLAYRNVTPYSTQLVLPAAGHSDSDCIMHPAVFRELVQGLKQGGKVAATLVQLSSLFFGL